MRRTYNTGFTIVELLIVIVIIAILAAISIVVYSGIQKRAIETALKSDLRGGASQLGLAKAENDTYPTDSSSTVASLSKSTGTIFQYTSDGQSYCLTATSSTAGIPAYHISSGGSIEEGVCSGHILSEGEPIADGVPMQTINTTNCSNDRTRAVDTRDNHTYWVQKLADGKCWMLTNLAYAGGGTNTYGDVKTLQNGTSDSATSWDHPKYYIPADANATVEPASPSASTDGGATGPHYGYLYNWCAAMGGQVSTSACADAMTPIPNMNMSVCASGWRLPTTSELSALNVAINGGHMNTDAGLRSVWLMQYGGAWSDYFGLQGSFGLYWSSSQGTTSRAGQLMFYDGSDLTLGYDADKFSGASVRCIAI